MSASADSPIQLSSSALVARFADHRLDRYLELLETENRRLNLVSRETSSNDRRRLAAESLAPLELTSTASLGRYLDLGSGGGLPAFPLILSPAGGEILPAQPVLLDRSDKKAAAIRRIALGLKVRVDIEVCEIEQYRPERRFDLITMRLVRVTPTILDRAIKLLDTDGRFCIYGECDLEPSDHQIAKSVPSYIVDGGTTVRRLTIYTRAS